VFWKRGGGSGNTSKFKRGIWIPRSRMSGGTVVQMPGLDETTQRVKACRALVGGCLEKGSDGGTGQDADRHVGSRRDGGKNRASSPNPMPGSRTKILPTERMADKLKGRASSM